MNYATSFRNRGTKDHMSVDGLRNPGIAILNPAGLASQEMPTIIVMGVARSGTSMVAAVLARLGVYLGVKKGSAVFEDLVVAKALERRHSAEIRAVIAERNNLGRIWGFKRPEALDNLSPLLPCFRNPRLVVTFRDPVAIAKRNQISMHQKFLPALERATTRTMDFARFLNSVTIPTMLISYEKAIADPAALVDALAEFCSLEADRNLRAACAAVISNGPTEYLHTSRMQFEGVFYGLRDGFAIGWVRRMPGKRICDVQIYSGDEIIGEGRADRNSDGLTERIGNHAFVIRVNAPTTERVMEARVKGTTYTLEKSKRFASG